MRRSMYLVACLTVIGLDFVVLGIMTLVPHQHHGACHLKMAFVFMMALVGGGFGTFLTVLPTLLEDIYGMANFGCVRVCGWAAVGVDGKRRSLLLVGSTMVQALHVVHAAGQHRVRSGRAHHHVGHQLSVPQLQLAVLGRRHAAAGFGWWCVGVRAAGDFADIRGRSSW